MLILTLIYQAALSLNLVIESQDCPEDLMNNWQKLGDPDKSIIEDLYQCCGFKNPVERLACSASRSQGCSAALCGVFEKTSYNFRLGAMISVLIEVS